MSTPQDPAPLSNLLAAWKVSGRRAPGFRGEVLSRIEAISARVPWGVFARRHFAMVSGALALALVVGALSGHGSARSKVAAESERLAAAYVSGLDARSMQMP